MFAPIRSSPIALFLREHTAEWLALAPPTGAPELSPEAAQILQMLAQRGALFFGELLKTRSLLASRVEQTLAELATQGWVTADSFEGMRALLLPQEKRVPFAGSARRRRHKAVSSVEFAGRWSLLRDPNTISPVPGEAQAGHYLQSGAGVSPVSAGVSPASAAAPGRDEAVETFARVLLRRYGVVFRAMLARESLKVSWYELGRVYRRLKSRGEIRGGHFVSGVGGEQFALPEAIGLLRSIRKTAPDGQTVTISGADPLNLTGILGPGRRVAATTANCVLLRAGVPVAALVAGEVENLEDGTGTPGPSFERALRVGSMQAALRPYYG
jgi:ATP-dependent Lhr-like helicase